MMKIQGILKIFIILCILALSCQPKSSSDNNENDDVWKNLSKYENMEIKANQPYEYERKILQNLIATFSRLNRKVENAQNADDVAKALDELNNSLKELNPAISQITLDNPDWGTSPPRELSQIIKDYLTANQNFTEHTMNLVGQYLIDNPNHKELHDAYNRLNGR